MPNSKPVRPGQAARHAFVEGGQRPVEPLDVHQEDAEQREAAHHIERFDALALGHRRERRQGGRSGR
jgi:hypothetical protein